MAPPTAIVTGGCSGIGLSLTKHLLERKWQVVQADINPPKEALDSTKYVKCDVSSWDDQAALFEQAYEWTGRLDFCALNAGIDDRDDIFRSISTSKPRKPNMKVLWFLYVQSRPSNLLLTYHNHQTRTDSWS